MLLSRVRTADRHRVNALGDRLLAEYADICSMRVDAIVNPAHRNLLGGGGLDGAIHDAAGPELLAACRLLGGCDVGDAKTTPGFSLPARWVIHTVGPIWRGGNDDEHEMLASCYRRCVEEAAKLDVRRLAFPGISTGLHGFPLEQAATVAVTEVRRCLARLSTPRHVVFVCFDNASITAYDRLLQNL